MIEQISQEQIRAAVAAQVAEMAKGFYVSMIQSHYATHGSLPDRDEMRSLAAGAQVAAQAYLEGLAKHYHDSQAVSGGKPDPSPDRTGCP